MIHIMIAHQKNYNTIDELKYLSLLKCKHILNAIN